MCSAQLHGFKKLISGEKGGFAAKYFKARWGAKTRTTVQRILVTTLCGILVVNPRNSDTSRIHFSHLAGLLAVKLKSLEHNASEHMDNLTGKDG